MLNCVIIIPTLNEEGKIGELIQSLKGDEYPNKEIIVVDGGSKDKTVEISKKNGAIVIIEQKGNKSSPALARNQGAMHAIENENAEVLCFIDGDLVLSPDFISHGMFHFNTNPKIAAVRTIADSIRDSLLMKSYSPIVDMTKLIKEDDDSPPPPAHFYRSEIFEQAGGFEPLGFREDWALHNKVREIAHKDGRKIVLEEKCIRYGKLDSVKDFYKQQEWYGRTFFPYAKHAGWEKGLKDLFVLMPIGYVINIIVSLGAFSITGKSIFLILGVPFGIKMIKIIYRSIKYQSAYVFPHFLLNSIGNYFFIKGMMKYIIGDNRLSRGDE
tara:strand:+ start:1505 stop:2482 length:978 start_codon:yes stop_codon:yes gene_type:complete